MASPLENESEIIFETAYSEEYDYFTKNNLNELVFLTHKKKKMISLLDFPLKYTVNNFEIYKRI